ncbi:single-stranded DNA-binding protein [Buttiauxella sp. BIGb0552]|nr:single-stranded DNA-binding protein [Buttiauxella sp. BIGb0552]
MNEAVLTLSGRINSDPLERGTKSGGTMASCFASAASTDNNGTHYLNVNVVAFNELADLLMRHVKGDQVVLFGDLAATGWVGKDGELRNGLTLTLRGIQSVKIRPANRTCGSYRHQQELQGTAAPQPPHRGADAQGQSSRW